MAYWLAKLETLGPFINGETEPKRNKAWIPIWQQKTKKQKCAINKDRTRKSHMESLFFLIFSYCLFFPHEFPVQAATSFKNLGQAEK